MKAKLKVFSATASLVALSLAVAVPGMAIPQQAGPPTTQAADPPTNSSPNSSSKEDTGWPRQINSPSSTDAEQIVVYQPQVESWKQNKLDQRAVVSIQSKEAAEPTLGVIWISSRTEVDKSTHRVTLEDTQITKVSFPSAPDKADDYLSKLRKEVPALIRPMSLDRLQASLAITKAEARAPEAKLKNEPPQIIYSKKPGILVLIDGKPVLRDAGAGGLLRVINTRALIVMDQSQGKYYFYLGDRWMTANSLDKNATWKPATKISGELKASLDQVKTRTSQAKEVDLLNEDTSVMSQLQKGSLPQIYVSTGPAELIQTKGDPQFLPVADTQLLYVKNTPNDIFLNTSDQSYYVTISGRWYRAKTLNGPWTYVAPSKLPQDFAKIPDNHPKGSVLASVADTPQAKEAAISNQIPQTATIDRQKAGIAVNYDGQPEFKPIEGTPLQYAINTATPVIKVDEHSYYSVQNGVWFVATSPQGPWSVATQVPSVIYTIPPSSPLYYVTYVYVYGSTPQYVYVGYYPGYLGSYLGPDGVVVYGTGYYYSPWIGSVWYGWPVTYGFGIGWGVGFAFGFGIGYVGGFYGPCFHPWWGPYGYAWAHGFPRAYPGGGFYRPVGPAAYRGFAYNHYNINNTNVYNSWNRSVVKTSAGRTTALTTPTRSSAPNNLYADSHGTVYRNSGGGNWERYNSSAGKWQKSSQPAGVSRNGPNVGNAGNRNFAGTPAGGGTVSRGGGENRFESPPQEIEQERQARETGESRANQFHQQSGAYGGIHNFGGGGGGGFYGGSSGRRYMPVPSGPSGGGGHMGGFGGGGHMGGGGRH